MWLSVRSLYRAWLSGGSKRSANLHLVREPPRPQPRTSKLRPQAPFQRSGARLSHVTCSSQWARRRWSVADKGACCCPLAAAIGVRAGGDGLWRTASLDRFILCKLKGAI